MQQLLEGVHRFQQREFGRYKEVFRRLSREGQKPHTLFITCADSRVVAELITQSKPGDLFVIKNIGNIVPPADVNMPPATSSPLYTVSAFTTVDQFTNVPFTPLPSADHVFPFHCAMLFGTEDGHRGPLKFIGSRQDLSGAAVEAYHAVLE